MDSFIWRFFNKTKGTISVFLVIILVPMMAMCSLFVDASRIKLSQAVIASAADSSLNAVLSEFDKELAEVYGLMASCQSDKEVVEKAKEYFKNSLLSQGLDDSKAENYANSLAGVVGGDSIDDFLGILVNDDLSIKTASNGKLTNTAVFKDELIEFMKYRAPIEAVTDLIEKFKKIKSKADTADEETKMIEEMEDYYDTENKVLKKCKELYDLIKAYNKAVPSKEYIEECVKYISDLEGTYKAIHKRAYKDFSNTAGVSAFTYKTSFAAKKKTITKTTYNRSSFQTELKNMANCVYCFNYYDSQFRNASNNLPSTNNAYGVQYWVQAAAKINANNAKANYEQWAVNVNYYYNIVKAIKDDFSLIQPFKDESFELRDISRGRYNYGTDTFQAHVVTLEGKLKELKNYIDTSGNRYNNVCRTIKGYSDNNISKINRNETNNQLKNISEKLTGYYDKLEEARKATAKIVDKAGELQPLVSKLREDFSNFKKAANNSALNNNEMAENVRKEVKNEEKGKESTYNNVTSDNVAALKTRFTNINQLFVNCKKFIDETKYGTKQKKVKDIKNVDALLAASGIDTNSIPVNSSTLENQANSTFKFYKSSVTIKIDNNNNPNINVNTPKLYIYLKARFEKPKDSKYSESDYDEKKKDKEDSTKDKEEKGNEVSKNEIIEKSSLPSQGKGGQGSSAKTSHEIKNVANFIGTFFKDFNQGLENSRDLLYELGYIRKMFSYDTFEYEGKFDLATDGSSSKSFKLEEADSKYSSVADKWSSKDKKFTKNKTLTNRMINNDNNYSFGNELEYILYGKKNEENKKSAYNTIFAIRYAFNLTYGFTKIYSHDKALDALAQGVAVATQGIIPAPLTKIVVVLGLVALESVYDIQCLKKGLPVAVFKGDDQWRNKFSGNKGDNKNIDKTIAFQYSDYLTLFLFLKLIGDENGILLRTEDVIQCNMQKISGYGDFKMNKCKVYYELKATCKTDYLMLSMPIIERSTNTTTIKGKSWNSFEITAYRGY